MKIVLLENTPFLKKDGTFDMQKALMFSGHVGGICYNKDGLMASFEEPEDVTEARINSTTSSEHQSVFEHVNIGMYIKDAAKELFMVLNNEGQFQTSERSLRYTKLIKEECNLTDKEINLYYKWFEILKTKITEAYGEQLKPFKIRTLAQENARYMISSFINTEMVHTIPLVQLNRIVTYMKEYMQKENKNAYEERLSQEFNDFINECSRLQLLDERLESNKKQRKLRIFGDNLSKIPEEFGVTYSTNYKVTKISFAQLQRHRTINYKIERDKKQKFYVPEIIQDDKKLVKEWLEDLEQVKDCFPLGELFIVNEQGTFDSFILKLKERDCQAVQLETFRVSVETKEKYYKALEEKNHPYAKIMKSYMKGRRCTYKDYNCPTPCTFIEGKKGTRRV